MKQKILCQLNIHKFIIKELFFKINHEGESSCLMECSCCKKKKYLWKDKHIKVTLNVFNRNEYVNSD